MAGCLFEILLPASGTETGGWAFVAEVLVDPPLVTLLAVIEAEPGGTPVVWAAAGRRWRFRAERPGIATLRFENRGALPASTDILAIDVAIVPEKVPEEG